MSKSDGDFFAKIVGSIIGFFLGAGLVLAYTVFYVAFFMPGILVSALASRSDIMRKRVRTAIVWAAATVLIPTIVMKVVDVDS